MPRRIDLELTSDRGDGTWTWRAAGALQPRGELAGAILPGSAKVGDVLRAEADFDVEGITVLSVLPPKGARSEPERLEILGSGREFTPVTSTLVTRGRGERPPRGPRPEGRDRDRDSRGPRPERNDRPGRGDRPDRPDRTDRPARPPRAPRPAGERPPRPKPPAPKPKAKKLRAGRQHRDELMATLAPEQVAVADQLFRGGMPGVRTALAEQNAANAKEGLPAVPEAAILGIAEQLLPKVRVADWMDRAEAAVADAEELSLRDLRAVVASADDVAREESTRALATQLKDVLERRSGAEQQEWLADLKSSLDGGRVVRALRLASRPPDPNEAVPDDLLTKLSDAASAAMTADVLPDRWATLLDAVAYSPVRRTVTPVGAPAEPGDELMAAVRKHASRVPTVAALFGVAAPERAEGGRRPARPARPVRKAPPRAADVQAEAGLLPPPGARRIPPPPAVAPAPVVDDAQAPVAEAPAPVVDDAPAPVAEALAPASVVDNAPASVAEDVAAPAPADDAPATADEG